MENSIIGTAGHVDHGKTMLIQALTGIDTDRLQEEKKRGITIELGFAYLDFPNGQRVGIIDVPGHEKFIRNMLAGAGGVDFALLVVAADEGFMPQTVEHLDILCLLGLQDGLVVITKTDMVDAEMLAMVQADVEAHVQGTFLEGKPILPVSALTGAGIPQLRALLQERLQQAPVKNLRKPFRLPVDRVFSVDGFGTVVTGTLVEGQIEENDEAQLYPSGLRAKVRNLQVHGQTVPQARAGQRVAVNLVGLKKSDIQRGDTLACTGSLENSWMLDVRLEALADSCRQILNHSQVHLYHGARVLLAKVVLLDRDQLVPGESAYAQLRLQEPLAARAGDRFVIRFYSPLETIGGGIVLDPNPPRHKRQDAAVLTALQVREAGSLAERLLQRIVESGTACISRSELADQFSLSQAELIPELQTLLEEGQVVEWEGRLLALVVADQLWPRLENLLLSYHRQNPLQKGMRREELRQKFPAEGLLTLFLCEGRLQENGGRIALSGFLPRFSPKQEEMRAKLGKLFAEAGLEVPSIEEIYRYFAKEKELCRQVLGAMIESGELMLLNPQLVYPAARYEQVLTKTQAFFKENTSLTLAQFRDLLGTSRKYALAILEHFDREKRTKKIGDSRVWLG